MELGIRIWLWGLGPWEPMNSANKLRMAIALHLDNVTTLLERHHGGFVNDTFEVSAVEQP